MSTPGRHRGPDEPREVTSPFAGPARRNSHKLPSLVGGACRAGPCQTGVDQIHKISLIAAVLPRIVFLVNESVNDSRRDSAYCSQAQTHLPVKGDAVSSAEVDLGGDRYP